MPLAFAGNMPKCLHELHKLRESGYPAASAQLAYIEKDLSEWYEYSKYYHSMLEEAASRGHVLALASLLNKRADKKHGAVSKIYEKLKLFGKCIRAFLKPNLIELRPMPSKTPPINPDVVSSQNIWTAEVQLEGMSPDPVKERVRF